MPSQGGHKPPMMPFHEYMDRSDPDDEEDRPTPTLGLVDDDFGIPPDSDDIGALRGTDEPT